MRSDEEHRSTEASSGGGVVLGDAYLVVNVAPLRQARVEAG